MTRTPAPERRQRLAASARRAQLVAVGRMVFAQHGYEATSVEENAEGAGRRGGMSAGQCREAGGGAKADAIDAQALGGMVAFVGRWWTEGRKPPPVESVASHLAALAWMGLRHLPRRPVLLATGGRRA